MDRLIPLVVGTLRVNIRRFNPAAPVEHDIVAPVVIWLLEWNGRLLLFDTGGTPVAAALHMGHRHYSQSDAQEPLRRLASVGVRPRDVDVVVLSHLHWDHAANWHAFPRAKVLVHEQEVPYALAPDPEQRVYFDYGDHPASYIQPPHFTLVQDGYSVWGDCPDVTLTHLPGHTPGSQGVVIRAPRGLILLAGDAVPLLQNLARDPPVVNGIATDPTVFAKTLRSLPRGCNVFPSHDPAVAKYDGINVLDGQYWKGGRFLWN